MTDNVKKALELFEDFHSNNEWFDNETAKTIRQAMQGHGSDVCVKQKPVDDTQPDLLPIDRQLIQAMRAYCTEFLLRTETTPALSTAHHIPQTAGME
jgi:hypothetical protein